MSNTNDPLGNKLEIMLEPGNLYLTDYAISRLPSDAPMLEIGSFCDLSTNILTHYEHKHRRNNQLFSCDKWEFENRSGSSIGDSSVSFDRYKQFVRDWFLRNIRTFSEHDLPSPSNCFPASFSTFGSEKKLPGTFSTGAFLSEVRSVFVMWTGTIHTKVQNGILKIATLPRFLQVGGFILFDDSTDSVFGLMPEVLATGRYRLVARNPNHLFQKMQIWLIKTSGGD